MKAIYKRELKSYFDSMIGYVFVLPKKENQRQIRCF